MVGRLSGWLRRLRRSFILRLTLILALLFAAGMAVTIYVALSLGRDAIISRADTTLAGVAASISAGTIVDESAGLIVRPLTGIGDLPAAFASIAKAGGGTAQLDDDYRQAEDWRVSIARNPAGNAFVIAVPLDDGEDALELLEGILWSVALVVLLVSLAIGIGAGTLAGRRLSLITATLGRLAAGDLGARTGTVKRADDLDDLAHRVDATAGELERLVAQTRNLSASLAHDLRTPLARLRARLEKLPEGGERSAALEEAQRLSEIFDTIMRVARIEATQGQDGLVTVDLGELANDLAEIFGPVIEDAGKTLELDIVGAGTVKADRQMLVQAMANLIQNALVHGGNKVVVFVRGTQIGVCDDGPGVPASQFSEIIKPMVRLDNARKTDGTGLGLALVRAVTDRHGAELNLSDNRPQGLCVTLDFTNL